jgi:phosphoribosylformylglycinamidine cyclo-ligase
MVHNTGGGQTKCLSLGKDVSYVKDALPEPDPIFHLIQEEGRVEWREMYEDFNMGIGFEFIVEPEAAEEVIRIADGFGIGVRVVGCCERSETGNTLRINSRLGEFSYPSI